MSTALHYITKVYQFQQIQLFLVIRCYGNKSDRVIEVILEPQHWFESWISNVQFSSDGRKALVVTN